MRRLAAGLLVTGILVALGLGPGIDAVGGASSHAPSELASGLSPDAQKLVARAFEGIEPGRLTDYHVHVVGLGTNGSGALVNPVMQSWAHPVHHIKFLVYASAAGIDDFAVADEQYVSRLESLVAAIPGAGRYHLLAFDQHYRPDGTVDAAKTEFYVPNEYVFALAAKNPAFVPTMSVHPYRKDAIEELERWATAGGRTLKWLPNAMGIDPADERIDPFYDRMRELGVTLVSHAGEEKAVEAEEDQALGNPLKLRRALDHGVKVVVAHCASLGQNLDLDADVPTPKDNFDLFLRLMDEKKYRGLLFGEISAMTQFNRVGKPLVTMLGRDDLHGRLVNGSDYPLLAINVIIRTSTLVDEGLISEEERDLLNEIYEYNPLLFDFVVKRTMRSPTTKSAFPAEVFQDRPELSGKARTPGG